MPCCALSSVGAMCERSIGYAMVALLMGAGGAQAADGALSMRKTSAPILAYDWTGVYIGGHIGAGVSYRDWTLIDGRISEAGDALLLGGQIGVNSGRQMGDRSRRRRLLGQPEG